MKKCLTALTAAFALSVIAAPTAADARRVWRAGAAVAVAKPYYYRAPAPGLYYLYPINQAYAWPVPVYYLYPTPGPYFGCWRYEIFVC
jgi:hypothetical protein